MYIRRKPLGQGGPNFSGRRRSRIPVVRVLLYLAVLLGAIIIYLRMDVIQPQVLARLGPSPTPTQSIDAYVAQAEAAYLNGELDPAIDAYRNAVAMDPSNIDHLFALSRLLLLTDNVEEGLAMAEQTVLADPESPKGYAIKAMALDWNGSPEQAIIEALKAIEIDSNYAPAYAYLAEAQVDLGRWTQARENAEIAVALDPFDVDARRNYAYLLEFLGDYNGAIEQYQQAIAMNDNLLFLLYGLARNYRGAGQAEEAINTFRTIADRTPEDPEPWVEIGKTYFELREDNAAQENFETAMQLVCPDCPLHSSEELLSDDVPWQEENRTLPEEVYMPAWVRLGQVYFTRRNYEDALAVLDEAIAWGEAHAGESGVPDVPIEAYYVSASAYYYLDLCDRAMPRAEQALDLFEHRRLEDQNALNNILRVYVLCRDYAITPPSQPVIFPDRYPEPEVLIELPNDATNPATEQPPGEGDVMDADQ